MTTNVDELGICTNGHVTDPTVDIDTRTGSVVSPARQMLYDRGLVERASDAWRTVCRACSGRGTVRSPHVCRAPVVPLSSKPHLASAYLLGGQDAVDVVLRERGWHA